MKKLGLNLLILLLIISTIPMHSVEILAESTDSSSTDEIVLLSENEDQDIELYKDDNAEELLLLIPTNTTVSLLSNGTKGDYIPVRYTYVDENEDEQTLEGYVHKSTIQSDEYTEKDKKEDNSRDHFNESVESEIEKLEQVDEVNKVEEENSINHNTNIEQEDISEKNSINDKSFSSTAVQESKTSKLGHIISGDVDIYEKEINGKSIRAGSQYTNAVYYIKRQAKLGNDTYYLISKSPSDTKGVVGWVKESDLSIRTHVGVDKKSKTFYIKGNGKATTKAWGGKKDTVYGDLSGYINEPFKVHLTEKVGNNTWYRGTLGGKTVWLHSSYVYEATKSKTSLLGHIRSGKVQIYESIGGKSISAGSKYTNAVYYIKEEAKSGNDTYYLISKSPSATRGVVGWVKEDDLSLHTHVGVDKKDKTLYIKGNGIAYAKAWGGKKDLVYDTNKLSQYKGQAFKIHLTEKVGNNTWYRGMLDGKQVWLHSSYVEEPQGTKTSMLAHIVSGSVEIYETIGGKSFKAGATYTNAVYYIKLKRKVGNQEYYLISTSPSSVNGVVGWVKVEDLSYHDHVGVDKKAKTFYIKGNGKAYTKAWGGSKNLVYDLSNYKGELFNVHLTEKVGKNTWYRGKINGKGKTIWIHSNYLIPTSKVVVIDAGHGGIDTGARGNGLLEKNISLDLALRTQKRLESLGYTVIMTRTTDKTLKLEQRTKIANDSNADIFVSIHINAGGGTGIETWMQSNSYEGAKSFELAESIQNEVIKQTNVRDRGVKDGNLHVNRETKMPSSLIEVGFIDNKDDANKLKMKVLKI